jgi:hypothetical protein
MTPDRKKSGRRLLPWQRQAALDAYVAGEKLAVIAVEFGCSDAAISQLAKRHGLARRPTHDFRTSRLKAVPRV